MFAASQSVDVLVAQNDRRRLMISRVRVVMLLLAGVWVTGCGSKPGPARVPVAGTVSLDGEPVKAGCIRFIPTDATKGPAAVAIIKEGSYELGKTDGPVAGTLRVEIEATDFQEFELDDEKAYAARAVKGKSPLKKNPIPPLYNRNSTLTAQLTAEGNRTLDFPLSSKEGGARSR